jgi:hypothetical protein
MYRPEGLGFVGMVAASFKLQTEFRCSSRLLELVSFCRCCPVHDMHCIRIRMCMRYTCLCVHTDTVRRRIGACVYVYTVCIRTSFAACIRTIVTAACIWTIFTAAVVDADADADADGFRILSKGLLAPYRVTTYAYVRVHEQTDGCSTYTHSRACTCTNTRAKPPETRRSCTYMRTLEAYAKGHIRIAYVYTWT